MPKYELETVALQLIADRLCREFELAPVIVCVDGRLIKRYGTAYYGTRRLFISPKILEYPEIVNNTIRHEVAHFLAFDKYGTKGHSRIWKQCAITVGAQPETYAAFTFNRELNGVRYIYECGSGCRQEASRIRPRYERGTCLKHGHSFTRNRV